MSQRVIIARLTLLLFVSGGAANVPLDVASRICVANEGIYEMRYNFLDQSNGTESDYSPYFLIGQSVCKDLSDLQEAAVGDRIVMKADVVLGLPYQSVDEIIYSKARDVTLGYTCTGTILTPQCELTTEPTPDDWPQCVEKFVGGVIKGLATEVGLVECFTGTEDIYKTVRSLVDLFHDGFQANNIFSIERAFQIVGKLLTLLTEIVDTVDACKETWEWIKGWMELAEDLVDKNFVGLLEIALDEVVTIASHAKAITRDCEKMQIAWEEQNCYRTGVKIGYITGILTGAELANKTAANKTGAMIVV